MFFAPLLKIKIQIQNSDYWCDRARTDHIQIMIKILNPNQEHPVSFQAPNQDLKDMDVLCIFKIKIESQNLYNSEHGCINEQ